VVRFVATLMSALLAETRVVAVFAMLAVLAVVATLVLVEVSLVEETFLAVLPVFFVAL